MEKIFISPACYVQGRGVLKTGIHHIKKLGDNALVLCDDVVWGIVGESFCQDLLAADMQVQRIAFKGESSQTEINRLAELGQKDQVNIILALGGGKTLDVGKAIADAMDVPVVILPTTASTDAPTSAISVIYSDTGVFEKYVYYKKNPELVLVDTEVISKAPVRLLTSGIADALATWVEVRAVLQKNGTTLAGGTVTLAATAIAEKCEQVLFENGLQAVEANRAKVVTAAFDAVVEANTLLSGIGFESGGLAAAHAIHNAFFALKGDIHTLTHGEKVAFGTLTQLVLENRPMAELNRYIRFYQALGLPTTLADMKLAEASYDDLLKVGVQATIANDSMKQMPLEITAEAVADAMLAVDAYVKALGV